MKTVDIFLSGLSGYGDVYLDLIAKTPGVRLLAAADPFFRAPGSSAFLPFHGIPVFNDPEEYFASGGRADLVIISSPIQYHRQQAETALRYGAAVLCEKPLCACSRDAYALKEAADRTGLPFGVGFQWSFSETMLSLKRDILSGAFGRPLSLKTLVSWPRGDAYYRKEGWKGRRADDAGRAVNDSVVMNATAHYLHNMLFILGDALNASACPRTIEGVLLNAVPIQTFDTCFIRGIFADGCRLLFAASHVAMERADPIFEYRFEKGAVFFNENISGFVKAVFHDGREKTYGEPQSEAEAARKFTAMVDAVRSGIPPVCGIAASLPHLLICDVLNYHLKAVPFRGDLVTRRKNPDGYGVTGLNAALTAFYQTGKLPEGLAVSPPGKAVDIHP